jgi:undecaprenyl-diphosphatase
MNPLVTVRDFASKRGMPEWLAIIILGIIEGITEFLPVSSTGHLLVAEHWLPRQTDLFNIVIQCGAVVAVIPVFWTRISQMLLQWREPKVQDYTMKLATAFFITGVGGLVLDKLKFKLPEKLMPVGIALLVGGVLFVVIERWLRGKTLRDEITWNIAIAVGIGQLVAAVFPGASRSGTCIIAMLLLGASRPLATEFSFIIGIPTLLAAGGLKIFKAFRHPVPGVQENWPMVALGTIVAAIVSFIAVKWLLRYIQTHTFTCFGWYRIVFGGIILIIAFGK